MAAELEGVARFGVGAHEAQHDKGDKNSDAEYYLAIHGDPQFCKRECFQS
ncbi:MAG: hypothetical protein K2Y37_16430 [Pirellulales bacterium]|nr:hypothetical protein [Pirellulales bacterium]